VNFERKNFIEKNRNRTRAAAAVVVVGVGVVVGRKREMTLRTAMGQEDKDL